MSTCTSRLFRLYVQRHLGPRLNSLNAIILYEGQNWNNVEEHEIPEGDGLP